MFVFPLSGRPSGAVSAEIEVGGEESEWKSADAEGHLKAAVSAGISGAGSAEMRAADAVGIVPGIGVEVGGREAPTPEKILESASSVGGRFRSLTRRPRRNFLSRIRFVVGSPSVERNQFIAGNDGFADGASLPSRTRF